ncbi:hypothetical protein ElyMa_000835400 [Elysia marginata]|uniref:Uncharacterized protein n=1 Tax=Elysia marginata TaxID=1093978 RepID=A0AAV4GZS2_9GAST|nr:hypothetical protein ElyMa_000835400 [Elysia marginata]
MRNQKTAAVVLVVDDNDNEDDDDNNDDDDDNYDDDNDYDDKAYTDAVVDDKVASHVEKDKDASTVTDNIKTAAVASIEKDAT